MATKKTKPKTAPKKKPKAKARPKYKCFNCKKPTCICGRPVKYKTPADMQLMINLYFLACKFNFTNDEELIKGLPKKDKDVIERIDCIHPTVTGLAIALGMTRRTLIDYDGKTPAFSHTVKKAKARVEAYVEQRLYYANAVGSIFNLKNNFGWADKIDIENKSTVEIIRIIDDIPKDAK